VTICKQKQDGAYAPKFPKTKDEGWWLVIGDPSVGELIALKRLSMLQKNARANLTFNVPDLEGEYHYYFYLISDCYLGLDQQYDINFVVSSQQ
jgi:hypothetical protein